MNEKLLKLIYDIKYSIDEIDSYFEKRDKSFKNYSNDVILKRAVERNLDNYSTNIR